MTPRSNNRNGFLQKLVIILASTLVVPATLGFFFWLASSIVEIKVLAATANEKIDSLLETRRSDMANRQQSNTRRLDEIQGNTQ